LFMASSQGLEDAGRIIQSQLYKEELIS